MIENLKVVALAGGVGGAKLVGGLANVLPMNTLTIVVNTGDDFEYLGLKICPDLDTVCYTLAGIANQNTGWGRAGETWEVLKSLVELGGPDWFRLGDRDLGTHLERTRLLGDGMPLSQITQRFCQAWGVTPMVLPMSDDPVPTLVFTDEGEMPFQDYFVRRKCQPRVTGFRFMNAENTTPAPGILEALELASIIIICPSNPWVSIDPILAIPGIEEAIKSRVKAGKPVVAVSPIIGGVTVKGPAAKMYKELGYQPSALVVAEHYGAAKKDGLLSGFVLDKIDVEYVQAIEGSCMEVLLTETIMHTLGDRERLAEEVVKLGVQLCRKPG
jgi:LPPG:FO 2-phospho-L-lactate transferase